nr:MAG TPA: hypothetical protein [Caudoviricetes sp.]
MDIDEFIYLLACARYVQELESDVVARAIGKVMPEQ